MPPVRLAVSLHCSTDTERSLLLPFLYSLMEVLDEYITITGRRITFEWALIDGTNDTPEVARQLGRLITQSITTTTIRDVDDDDGNERIVDITVPKLRRDMFHINVIPLNPTTKHSGSPSQRHRVGTFVDILQN
jgi:23S rRNA (adenine2503-C2)-methyltransferase